jgi:23S rRNA pseudouridine1911/1915/1917 synthase
MAAHLGRINRSLKPCLHLAPCPAFQSHIQSHIRVIILFEEFTVPDGVVPGRADKILATHFDATSRSHVQRLIDDGRVTIQGRSIDRKHKLVPGDVLRIFLPPPPAEEIIPVDIPLDVLFEDEHILAINKTSGIVTHPGGGTGNDTLVHAAMYHTGGRLAPAAGQLRPGIVHRLDKDTSGVILLAKTDVAYYEMVRQFSERQLDKQYIALVDKCPNLLSGSIHEPLARNPLSHKKMAVREDGKTAHTDWAVEERFGESAARVRCWLHTGRTHQIRVHLSHIGHALLGDRTYGRFYNSGYADWPLSRVMLHAEHISLAHPVTHLPLTIAAPVPADFLAAEAWLSERFGRRPVVKIEAANHYHP